MIENDRTLIAQMIADVRSPAERRARHAARPHRGRAATRACPDEPDGDLQIGSPTCQACHQPSAGAARRRAASSRPAGGTVLRTVVPIRNREACHRCHDPAHADQRHPDPRPRTSATIRASINRDLGWMVGGTGRPRSSSWRAIAGVFRLVVLRRLQRFETTARQIASGDLDRRVPAEGSDTISWLAREFNAMADSVTGAGRTRCGASASGSRRSSTASTTGSSCSTPTARSSPRTTPSSPRTGRDARDRRSAARCRGRASRACDGRATARPRPACASGQRADAHLRAPAPDGDVRLGGDPRVARFAGAGRQGRPRRGGLARHLGSARGRGVAGRVAPARVARPARLRASPTN